MRCVVLLVLLAVAVLGPDLSESRTVSKKELKEMFYKKLHLPHRLLRYKKKIIRIVVCEVHRRTRLQTDSVTVFGTRETTMAKPKTTTTTTTAPPTTTTTTTPSPTTTTTTAPPTTTTTTTPSPPTTTTTTTPPPHSSAEPTALDTAGSNSVEIGSRRRRSIALMDDEGSGMLMTTADQMNKEEHNVDESSGSSMTMEDELNKEEDKFDEEQMMRDDNTLESDSSEEDKPGTCNFQSKGWSLGYYGIFTLSDSHFCCSGYRWSQNVCKTDCRAFTDDDISDDVDCLIKSGFWRFLLRTASPRCWFYNNSL